MKYRVNFQDVGRDKEGWTRELAQRPTEPVLTRMVMERNALSSRYVECVLKNETSGAVIAGFHMVGKFTIEEVK